MNKKLLTTFDKWMRNSKIKKAFKDGYDNFVLSELIKALMENDHKSVRGLAKKAGLSSTVIQDIRSGKQKDMKVKNFLHVIQACGYELVLENGKERIPVGV
jgi:hypothetical protein